MELVLVFTISFLLFLMIIFIISKEKLKKSRKILNAFSELDLSEIEIKLAEATYTGFSQFGGVTKNAILHYGRGILIFMPSETHIFNRVFNNLPIIFIADKLKNLPTEFCYKKIEDILIKERMILIYNDLSLVKKKIEFSIYSEKENLKLKEIITEFKAINNR